MTERVQPVISAAELAACCRSSRWVELVAAELPYASLEELVEASDVAFTQLSERDWHEAFAGCSRIGTLIAEDQHGVQEQSGVAGASDELRRRLAEGNDEYERRFGFIFMIRAAGRTAEEMLAALEARLVHDRQTEFAMACEQQREIVTLRLRGLV